MLYHFTDTIRLPWIIHSGELRPDSNRYGGLPADLLWATSEANGDRTSSASSPDAMKAYRNGFTWHIRLSLASEHFRPWKELLAELPEWKPEHIQMLEKSARMLGQTSTANWYCRQGPLSTSSILEAHAKSYLGGRWIPITARAENCVGQGENRGFVINDIAYSSTRELRNGEPPAYVNLTKTPVERAK